MRYLLDTDAVSYLIKGKAQSLQAQVSQFGVGAFCLSAITKAELLYGVAKLPPEHRLHLLVAQCLKVFEVLPWPMDAAPYYAQIRHQLVSEGQPIGDMDMMIAAHALALGANLVTNNRRHYERIRLPLMIAPWAF